MTLKKDTIALLTEWHDRYQHRWRSTLGYAMSCLPLNCNLHEYVIKNKNISVEIRYFEEIVRKHHFKYLGCGISRVALLHKKTNLVVKIDFKVAKDMWSSDPSHIAHANKIELNALKAIEKTQYKDSLCFFPWTHAFNFRHTKILVQEYVKPDNTIESDYIYQLLEYAELCFYDLHNSNLFMRRGIPMIGDWGMSPNYRNLKRFAVKTAFFINQNKNWKQQRMKDKEKFQLALTQTDV